MIIGKCRYCGHPAYLIKYKKYICYNCRYIRIKTLAELQFLKQQEAFDKFILKVLSVDKPPSLCPSIAEKVLKIKEKLGLA